MPRELRALPSRPSLRYLKLEARRRRAAGEFPTLHDAQLAIAREHGLASWVALTRRIAAPPRPGHYALPQLRWVLSRFRDADGPGWVAPGDDELRQHVSAHVLSGMPPGDLVATIASMAADLRAEPVILAEGPLAVQVRIAGIEIFATVEADPPHRLTGVRRAPLGGRVADARAARPPGRADGAVPAAVVAIAEEACAALGLVGVVLAGGGPGTPVWGVARGWADLERAEALGTSRRLPAYGLSQPVTATAVLRLVAAGRVGLDDPANVHLRTVCLADSAVTVRELLTHTGGVDHPAAPFAESVPALVDLVGPVITCTGKRGAVQYSNAGYAALGQLVADVTGRPYADAVARLVLAPLGMRGARFPARWPAGDPAAVTGYDVTPAGAFAPAPPRVCTMPAAGGLWATAADLVRFGLGWSTLLPEALAREALQPRVPGWFGDGQRGLGWLIDRSGGVIGSAGTGPGGSASLLIRADDGHTYVALTNRQAPIEAVNVSVVRACAPPRRKGRTRQQPQ